MATKLAETLQGYAIEDLSVGMTADYVRSVGEAEIVAFADLSGDNNPVHLDEAFAAKTMFKGRIAHGMLSAAFISTALGTKLPGYGCIYMSQDLRFKAPVRIGDVVRTEVTVTEVIPEKKRAVLATKCYVGDKLVLEGSAMMMVPSKAERG
ncbi:MAG TPA: MaoC family dehydratase [Alphaproteobacteria bacterium]|nr:MaoC family dehydratase [Alphaproteobacteria bacterium]